MSNEIMLRQGGELAVPEFDVGRVVAQTAAIQQCLKAVMKENEHFGIIPGTPKPSLWQPGADKLCMLFRLRADYEIASSTERDDWIAITVRCRLYSITTGDEWGSGMGSSNSRETKYVSQSQAKLCPKCSKPAIIKGKDEYGGGWLCFKKKDGCGAKFKDDDKAIAGQATQVLTDKVWDLHNTLVKMACKRAKVAAVLTATAASDIFTQDLEDLQEAAVTYTPPGAREQATPAPKAATAAPPAQLAHGEPTNSPGTTWTPAPSAEPSRDTAAAPDPVDVAKAAFPGAVEREPGSDDDADDVPEAGDMVEVWRWVGEKINPNIKSKTNLKGEWVPAGFAPKRTDAQNRKLQALRAALKIEEDEWRPKLILHFSKESSGNLSVEEAGRLIDMLERRKDVEEAKRARQEARVPGMVAEINDALKETA